MEPNNTNNIKSSIGDLIIKLAQIDSNDWEAKRKFVTDNAQILLSDHAKSEIMELMSIQEDLLARKMFEYYIQLLDMCREMGIVLAFKSFRQRRSIVEERGKSITNAIQILVDATSQQDFESLFFEHQSTLLDELTLFLCDRLAEALLKSGRKEECRRVILIRSIVDDILQSKQ